MTCTLCDGTRIITDCRGPGCSHSDDHAYPCPRCQREVGPEPEWLDELDALFEAMLRHPAVRGRRSWTSA